MTKKYFTWFLKNYDNYEYFGDEAMSIRRRLKRMSERTIAPSPQEAIEIYVSFFKLYNDDPYSEKSKYIDGIRAKKTDFCLMFREPDNTPVSFAYKKELCGGVTEGELKDVLDAEKERKIKYYSDMLDYHANVMENTKNVIEDVTDSVSPHATDLTTVAFIFLAIIFGGLAIALFFVPAVGDFFGLVKKNAEGKNEFGVDCYVGLGLCGVLFILYVALSCIAGKKYAYYSNSNLIMYRMEDFEKRIQKNITKLRKNDSQQIRLCLRNGKKIKPLIVDTDYNRELRYFGTSLELIKMQLEQEPKAVKVLYYFVMVISVYAVGFLSFNPLSDYLKRAASEDVAEFLPFIFAAIPTIIMILVALKLKNKVRAWKVFVSIILTILIIGLLVLIATQKA
ncbi:MAG: hypothetical protein J6Y28_03625 [Acholeplasmatales bacterium]|nr:hypothetical protein [Acholeplasmatales bacterium]